MDISEENRTSNSNSESSSSPVPAEVSIELQEVETESLETAGQNMLDQIPSGYRLFARAAEIKSKHRQLQEEAKRREDEQTASMFQPKLVAKKQVVNDSEGSKSKAYDRLYEYSKLKQMKEVARKQAVEIQNLQQSKNKFITPDKATALYDRTMAKKREQEKKVGELAASLTPSFSPYLFSNERERSKSLGRAKSRGRDKKRESIDRLYSPHYMKNREEKLKSMQDKLNEESCTFKPILNKSTKTIQNEDADPVWTRLSKNNQQTEKNISDDANCTFKPDISKSQKSLMSPNPVHADGSKAYVRLYNSRDRSKSNSKYIPVSCDEELTFKPSLSSRKLKISSSEDSSDNRFETLYRQGTNKLKERRSLTKEQSWGKEDQEMNFKPNIKWGSPSNSKENVKTSMSESFTSGTSATTLISNNITGNRLDENDARIKPYPASQAGPIEDEKNYSSSNVFFGDQTNEQQQTLEGNKENVNYDTGQEMY